MEHIVLRVTRFVSRVRRPYGVRTALRAGVLHEQRHLHALIRLELGQQPRHVRLDRRDGHVQLGVPERRADELLGVVGLDRSAARKRVRHYSLGMRQRLGIAHTLLGDPEVLILDEPANGLDPEGMRWMRGLLRDFADRGGTVLLSSHLLHEVEALADRLVIIDLGRIVAEGSLAELLAGSGTLVIAPDEAGLRAALDAANLTARPSRDGGFIVDAEPEDVGRAALAGGVAVGRIGPSGGWGLEQLFFDLTKPQEAVS